jgi:hypothetical protein
MAQIALIACTKTKADCPSPAGLLYQSPLFRKSLLYALSRTDRVFILSAKHGVLQLNDFVEPYELSIKNLSPIQKSEWVNRVGERLKELIAAKDKVHVLAGYYRFFGRLGARSPCLLRANRWAIGLAGCVRTIARPDCSSSLHNFTHQCAIFMSDNMGAVFWENVLAEWTGPLAEYISY